MTDWLTLSCLQFTSLTAPPIHPLHVPEPADKQPTYRMPCRAGCLSGMPACAWSRTVGSLGCSWSLHGGPAHPPDRPQATSFHTPLLISRPTRTHSILGHSILLQPRQHPRPYPAQLSRHPTPQLTVAPRTLTANQPASQPVSHSQSGTTANLNNLQIPKIQNMNLFE